MRQFLTIFLLLLIGAGCQVKEHSLPDEKNEPPEDKPPEYIQSPNDVINMHGHITNLEKFYEFLEHIQQGEKDRIRVVSYTTEGAPMIHDIKYDGDLIYSTYDSTRDGYGPGSINKSNCRSITARERDSRTEYVLEGCDNEYGEQTVLNVEK